MISCSSSFASSTPATSLNVTFFCELDESFALLLPNESALLPPLCIWRMKKIQKPFKASTPTTTVATTKTNTPLLPPRPPDVDKVKDYDNPPYYLLLPLSV